MYGPDCTEYFGVCKEKLIDYYDVKPCDPAECGEGTDLFKAQLEVLSVGCFCDIDSIDIDDE